MKMYIGTMKIPEDFRYETGKEGQRYIVCTPEGGRFEVWVRMHLIDIR